MIYQSHFKSKVSYKFVIIVSEQNNQETENERYGSLSIDVMNGEDLKQKNFIAQSRRAPARFLPKAQYQTVEAGFT